MWVNKMVLCASLLATGLLAVSCGSKAPIPAATPVLTEPPREQTTLVSDGAELYPVKCASCHGENRFGRYGLGGALTPERLGGKSDDVIRKTISEGIPFTAMPAFERTLSPEEIEALLQFIKYTSP